MYLENLTTRKPRPFVYRLGYDNEKGITFRINPLAVEYLNKIPSSNFILDYFAQTGLKNFESNLSKNFGFNSCSVSCLVNGLIYLSFQPVTKFILSHKQCQFCSGGKIDFIGESPCYSCRGTGKKIFERDNSRDICASLFVLTRYLNWFCVMNDDHAFPENNFGMQNIFLQLDHTAGIGGEISSIVMEKLGILSEVDTRIQNIIRNMLHLYLRLEGKDQFPDFKFSIREYQFRCEPRNDGFYIEVPGQNGCSLHMVRNGEFACHNVDRDQQQICLLVGLASLMDLVP